MQVLAQSPEGPDEGDGEERHAGHAERALSPSFALPRGLEDKIMNELHENAGEMPPIPEPVRGRSSACNV